MKIDELRSDKTILDWFRSIRAAESTKQSYLIAMQFYTEFTGMSSEELLIEAEEEEQDRIPLRRRAIKTHLMDFRDYLEKSRDIAPLSIKTRMGAIMSFYKSNDIFVPVLPRSDKKAKPLEQHKAIPSKEDIREVLQLCDPLEKAILLVGISSGLAVNEICDLRVCDFNKGFDPETGITTLQLRREKTNYDFVTFLTPEASKAVQDYLSYRNRQIKSYDTRRINQVKKQNVVSDNGYLFICRHVSDKYLETNDEELRKLGEKTVISMYKHLSEDSQKSTDRGIWNIVRSHNLRKWFNSRLMNAGAEVMMVEFMMGHQIEGSKANYFISDPSELKEMYKRFIPYLTIQKEADISESPEYIRIKNENQVLQAETERHIVERKELQELRAELEAEKIAKAEAEEALILRVKTEAINEVMNTLKGETFDRENLSKKITLAEVFQTANKLKHGSPRKR